VTKVATSPASGTVSLSRAGLNLPTFIDHIDGGIVTLVVQDPAQPFRCFGQLRLPKGTNLTFQTSLGIEGFLSIRKWKELDKKLDNEDNPPDAPTLTDLFNV